jgi:hypothetical protein
MTDTPIFPSVAPQVQVVSADTVFSALADPARRRILIGLADGVPRTATAVTAFSGRRFDATLKHLAAMKTAGFLVTAPDATDRRRQAYSLAPGIIVATGPDGRKTMDFGYCLVRF